MELEEYLKKYTIKYDKKMIEKTQIFYDFIKEENQKYNLTTIVKPDDFCVKHIIDSLLPLQIIGSNKKLVDLGSGGGFPAIPLKIFDDTLDVTMVESIFKKTRFLNMAIEKLDLKNIKTKHIRAEDFGQKTRECFDVCTARALAELATLFEYALPLLKIGGKCVFYKAQNCPYELSRAANALNILGGKLCDVIHYNLEGQDRCVVVVKKVKPTPEKYPRGQNKPKLSPL